LDAPGGRDPRLLVVDHAQRSDLPADNVAVIVAAGQLAAGAVEAAHDAVHGADENRQLDGVEGEHPLQPLALEQVLQAASLVFHAPPGDEPAQPRTGAQPGTGARGAPRPYRARAERQYAEDAGPRARRYRHR